LEVQQGLGNAQIKRVITLVFLLTKYLSAVK